MLTALITDIMTEGFCEIAFLENGEKQKGRYIAENPKNIKAKRGDEVEVERTESRDIRKDARTAYIFPIVAFIAGFLLTGGRETPERILTGAILAVMAFVVSWLLNRRSRMFMRREYRIVRVTKAKNDF